MQKQNKIIILCDFDGVLCSLNKDSALKLLSFHNNNLKIPGEELLSKYFYSNPFYQDIDLGKLPYSEMLEKIRFDCWCGSRDSWFQLWDAIWNCYATDFVLLDYLLRIKVNCDKVVIVTDNHLEFRSWLTNRQEFTKLLNSVVCSAEVKCCKPSKEFFDVPLGRFNSGDATVLYVDDNAANVSAASLLGITGHHYKSGSETVAWLKTFLDRTL